MHTWKLMVDHEDYNLFFGSFTQRAGPFVVVASTRAGGNETIMYQPVGVLVEGKSSRVNLFNNSMTEQMARWATSAFTIVCYPKQYIVFPTWISQVNSTLWIRLHDERRHYMYPAKRCVGSYEKVITACLPWIHAYAHALMDVTVALFGFPRAILDQSFFVVTDAGPMRVLFEGLSCLGMNNRLAILRKGQYLYSENIYTYDVGGLDRQPPICFMRFRAHLKKKLKLDETPAFRYGFVNRPIGKARRIRNMEAIVAWARQEIPDINWEIVGCGNTMTAAARLFNSLRFFFTPHGAALMNVVYMQPRSVACEVQASHWHNSYSGISRMLGLFYVGARLGWMRHRWGSGANMPVEVGQAMIRTALDILKTA
jgi:hypothetical protein